MKFILGTKERMTQVFDEAGVAYPVTVLRVEPAVVTQVKDKETDGYESVQVAAGTAKGNRVSKAQKGHLGGAYAHVKEYRPTRSNDSIAEVTKGQSLDASAFAPGDRVNVSAVSKGKGFQGVVKRHGFSGASKTHGTKHNHRAPGSIGSTGPARVFKGVRMAGRMGGDRVTVKNLTVVQVNPKENVMLIKGAIPGRTGTLVEARGA